MRLAFHSQQADYGRRSRHVLVEHVNDDLSWSQDPDNPDRYLVLDPEPHWENVNKDSNRLDAMYDVLLLDHSMGAKLNE